MKPLKLTGFHKFVCLVIIAVLVILILGFAVSGRQSSDTLPDSGNVGNSTNDTEQNKDENGNHNQQTNKPSDEDINDTVTTPPATENQSYINQVTGLQVSSERYNKTPMAIVMNPNAPLYGISGSDLTIEFPIEYGYSRLLTFSTSETPLWKIGAIAPTRDYISNTARLFGGLLISFGKDDILNYSESPSDNFLLDLSLYGDSYCIENSTNIYASEDMISAAKAKKPFVPTELMYKSAPYNFLNFSSFRGTSSASTVIIPYSESNETELYYHQSSGRYIYYKSGSQKSDLLSGENISFKNIFILFADTTTYEKSEGTELVVNTETKGKGYYISSGSYVEFKWYVDDNGVLTFFTLSGEKLSVNPGNSYISYYKSSNTNKIVLV